MRDASEGVPVTGESLPAGAADDATAEPAEPAEQALPRHPRPFIVVGGGVGGLVVARDLAKAGEPVLLLEASDRLGGQVARHRVAGVELDAGAEAFATKNTAVIDLARELGLGDEVVVPEPAGAWLQGADGSARPLPGTSLLGIPGSPLAADVIATIGVGAAIRAYLETLLPGTFGAKSATLGELVRRRMGRRVLERLVAPVVMGVHSVHPDDLPLDRAVPGLRTALLREGSLARGVRSLRERAPAGSAVAGIRGGIARLIDELEADLRRYGAEVRLGVRVTEVRPGLVRLADAPGSALEGTVIVAAPGLLETPETTPAVLVSLVLDAPELAAAPRGSGLLVEAGAPGIRARALTHQTAKWAWLAERAEGHQVVRLSYAEELPGHVEVARRDAEALLGVALPADRVLGSSIVRWERAPVATSTPEGALRVGETAAGSGLAAIVAHARRTAAELLADPES